MLATTWLAMASWVVMQDVPPAGPADAGPAVDEAPPAVHAPPAAVDEESAIHIVLAAELGGGGLIPIAASAGPVPVLQLRPFLALSLGRFAFQVEGSVESAAIILLSATSSVSALYAIEATEESRIEVGAGAGAGFLLTVLVEDGGGGPTGNIFLMARKQWWFDRLGFGIGARAAVGKFEINDSFGGSTERFFVAPAFTAHIAARL